MLSSGRFLHSKSRPSVTTCAVWTCAAQGSSASILRDATDIAHREPLSRLRILTFLIPHSVIPRIPQNRIAAIPHPHPPARAMRDLVATFDTPDYYNILSILYRPYIPFVFREISAPSFGTFASAHAAVATPGLLLIKRG